MSPSDRRAMIMDAVEPLLREHGRTINTRQIAEAAGVAEGTVFRVFDSKEKLIDSVVARAFSAQPTLDQLTVIPAGLELAELLAAITAVLERAQTRSYDLLQALGPPPKGHGHGHGKDRAEFFRYLAAENQLVSQAISDQLAPFADELVLTVAQTTNLLRSFIFSLASPRVKYLHHDSRLSDDPPAVVDLLLYGVSRKPAVKRFDHEAAGERPPQAEDPDAAESGDRRPGSSHDTRNPTPPHPERQ